MTDALNPSDAILLALYESPGVMQTGILLKKAGLDIAFGEQMLLDLYAKGFIDGKVYGTLDKKRGLAGPRLLPAGAVYVEQNLLR